MYKRGIKRYGFADPLNPLTAYQNVLYNPFPRALISIAWAQQTTLFAPDSTVPNFHIYSADELAPFNSPNDDGTGRYINEIIFASGSGIPVIHDIWGPQWYSRTLLGFSQGGGHLERLYAPLGNIEIYIFDFIGNIRYNYFSIKFIEY